MSDIRAELAAAQHRIEELEREQLARLFNLGRVANPWRSSIRVIEEPQNIEVVRKLAELIEWSVPRERLLLLCDEVEALRSTHPSDTGAKTT